jgi:hypothetical protein
MMAHDRFLDRETQPEPEQVRNAIGREVLPVWEDVTAYLSTAFNGSQAEWRYYSAQHGWSLRYRQGSRQLVALFPERGSFSALITLSPEEDDQALEKVEFFNAKFREQINKISALPQGRWLWVRIEDHTDFVGLRLLLEIKQNSETGTD